MKLREISLTEADETGRKFCRFEDKEGVKETSPKYLSGLPRKIESLYSKKWRLTFVVMNFKQNSPHSGGFFPPMFICCNSRAESMTWRCSLI